MDDELDPSRQRDAEAAATATERAEEAKSTATERDDVSVHRFNELWDMTHRMKGELAANTSMTREMVERQQDMQARQVDQSVGLEDIRAATTEIVDLIKMKRAGGRFARAFSAFVNRCAKYWAPILTTAAAAAALWHTHGPKGWK